MSTDWGALAVELQAARFAHIADAGESRLAPGVLAVATGPFSNTENGVVSTGNELRPGLARELIDLFAQRHLPASWLHASGPAPDRVRDELLEAGCREETTGHDMGRELGDLELGSRRTPDGVRIEEVLDERGVDAWLDVASWFEDERDRDARRRLYLTLGLGPGRVLRHWVAWRDDRPIGLATAFFHDATVMLEHVQVVEDERRRGLGTALALVRLREARERGCTRAVLAPSPDGADLYRTLGFETSRTPLRRWFYLPLEP